MMYLFGKKHLWICLLLIGVILAGCTAQVPETTGSQTPQETDGQRLCITGTMAKDGAHQEYTVPGTERSVSVGYLKDVTVVIDGQPVALQEAIEQGLLMPEEIAAYARLDAIDGYCKLSVESEKGLATFCYRYPQFTVEAVDDILESPDGKQHHIQRIGIYAPGWNENISVAYYGDDGQPLAKEVWGITLALEDVHSTGATLVATQSGEGQQVGVLLLESFCIYCVDTGEFVHKQDDTIGNAIAGEVSVERNTTERVALDWSETLGELPAGNYIMEVMVLDYFDRSTVHPLIVKYQYSQSHRMEFTIP